MHTLDHGTLRGAVHGLLRSCTSRLRQPHPGLEAILWNTGLITGLLITSLLLAWLAEGGVLHPLKFLVPLVYILAEVVHIGCFGLIPAAAGHFVENLMVNLLFVPQNADKGFHELAIGRLSGGQVITASDIFLRDQGIC